MAFTVGELFAGVLGFSQGLSRYGFHPIWAVENDRHAQAVIRFQHPGLEIVDDVDDPAVLGLRTPDVVVFGSPCTDLSIAGGQAGIDGEASHLFFRAVEIVGRLRPAWAVFENVPNAIGIHGGDDFRRMVGAFADVGYGVAWRVLDAQFFGLPSDEGESFSWPRAILADVLEPSVAGKYYLTPRACRGLLTRALRRGRILPAALQEALESVASSYPVSPPLLELGIAREE